MVEQLLDQLQLLKLLPTLKFWKRGDNALVREIEFKNFVDAVQFMVLVAEAAEEMNHHPDMGVFNYKWVRLVLTTHRAGGITTKDIELAQKINAVYEHMME